MERSSGDKRSQSTLALIMDRIIILLAILIGIAQCYGYRRFSFKPQDDDDIAGSQSGQISHVSRIKILKGLQNILEDKIEREEETELRNLVDDEDKPAWRLWVNRVESQDHDGDRADIPMFRRVTRY